MKMAAGVLIGWALPTILKLSYGTPFFWPALAINAAVMLLALAMILAPKETMR